MIESIKLAYSVIKGKQKEAKEQEILHDLLTISSLAKQRACIAHARALAHATKLYEIALKEEAEAAVRTANLKALVDLV